MKRTRSTLTLGACFVFFGIPMTAQAVVEGVRDPYQELVEHYRAAFGLAADPVPSAGSEAFAGSLLAKARADDCYTGMGNAPVPPPCLAGTPKVDQSSVWGLTRAGRKLWFGTGANVACLTIGATLGQTTPFELPSFVCEFGNSYLATTLGIPAAIGDTRQPQIWTYDLDDPSPVTALEQVVLSGAADLRLKQTTGLRAAGSHRDVVFLAGPSRNAAMGVNLFAFDAVSGGFLGLSNLPQFDSVGSWRVLDGELYAVFGHTPTWLPGGGSVLRWSGTPQDPFRFETVGVLGSEAVDLAMHQGRLFVTTSSDPSTGEIASLYESPVVPPGGLTLFQQQSWTRVWSADRYEPDPLCVQTYGGGAVASYGGRLFWGTSHVPGLGFLSWAATFGLPLQRNAIAQAALGTHRASSLFRARVDQAGTLEAECIYGMPALPVYDTQYGWRLQQNRMNPPRWGPAGFGNLFNASTWTMQVDQGRLFVGMLDWSFLLGDLLQGLGIPAEFEVLGARRPGADLWCFPRRDAPARLVSADGLGNETNIGVRTMVADGGELYLGTANPMNLHPLGGWELHRLSLSTGTVDRVLEDGGPTSP